MNPVAKIYPYILFCSLQLILFSIPAGAEHVDFPTQLNTPRAQDKQTSNIGMALVSIFKKYISPVDSDRCPSFPSCSTYSSSAFKKHGFFIGWMMTVDRLIHEGKDEERVSPLYYADKKWKIYDPVENNDFWWFTEDQIDEKKHNE